MKMEELTVQGITPWMIWVWIFVGVAFCAVFAVVWKVIQIIREEKKNRKAEIEAIAQAAVKEKADKLAEDISEKVMDAMKEKFIGINEKLDSDKRRIEKLEKDMAKHEESLGNIGNTLNSINANIVDMNEGYRHIAMVMLANGDDEETHARNNLKMYLTTRPIAPMK